MPRRSSTALKDYNAKRNFAATPEPAGTHKPGKGGQYVIQKHDATRLHFDFRLELDGVLKSWAVTRGPSLDPAEKRLAVRTEDHPLAYGTFEGIIPRGQYGGGTVMLWDRGTWKPEGDARKGLAAGKLSFTLDGERLKGGFTLVRMAIDRGKKSSRENWLLIKQRDETADPKADPLETWQESVKTARSMASIASGEKSVAGRARALKAPAASARSARAMKHPLPSFVSPQLAFLKDKVPEGSEWLHEIKYDGYRTLAAVSGSEVRLFTRTGLDWSRKFGRLAEAFHGLKSAALIDGEVVVFDASGKSSFSALQKALTEGRDQDLRFVAFDLLVLGDTDLRQLPLHQRKKKLKALLGKRSGNLSYGDHIAGAGADALAHACRMGIEGLVSKDRNSRYVSRRSPAWIKTKCLDRAEYVIGGFSPSDKKGRAFASLLVGEFKGGELIYRGRVGTGFDAARIAGLEKKFTRLARQTSPFSDVPAVIAKAARWLRPELVAEIASTELTADGILRHPAFISLREDKPAAEVTGGDREAPGDMKKSAKSSRGVTLTHPGKIFYPEDQLSKRDVADYLEKAAPFMLPFVSNHPLSLMRCPDGLQAKCFFQKHSTPGMPAVFKTVMITEKDGDRAEYLYVDSADGIVSAAQIGALELHIWGAPRNNLEHPDRLVFDLDPDAKVDFSEVKAAARQLRDLLDAAGLKSFPMLTGGKGIHVVVPLDGANTWDEIKGFTSALARSLSEHEPERFVATASKEKRKGRIFIDWLRNERGATAVAPYSPRARKGAAVAMPVDWDELSRIRSADAFDFRNALARMAKKGGKVWQGYGTRQHLRRETIAAAGHLFAS